VREEEDGQDNGDGDDERRELVGEYSEKLQGVGEGREDPGGEIGVLVEGGGRPTGHAADDIAGD